MSVSRILNVTWLLISTLVPAFGQSVGNWKVEPSQTTPPPRTNSCLVYDSTHGRVLLLGGYFSPGAGAGVTYLTDLWAWDGTAWTQIITPHTYPTVGACAFDSAHGQVVVVTPQNPTFPGLNQTWLYDGTDWTMATPQHTPTGRNIFSMGYDASRGQVVLFGGASYFVSNLLFNDTWIWDGNDWTQQSPKNSPSMRYQHRMAYDSLHGQLVLFGGISFTVSSSGSTTTRYNDTWTWDGSNWTQQNPQTVPSGRAGPSMTFDAAHGHILMFGGSDATAHTVADTWTWDGSNWTQQFPQTSPPAADGLTFDAAHGQAVMFGGSPNVTTYFNTTTLWSEGAPTVTQPVITSVIGASGFGGLPTAGIGSWIEIYGFDLSALTRQWAGSDFNGNSAPTSLSGVQVSIGGQAAFVEYVAAASGGSQGQINAQVPAGVSPGIQPLIVKNGGTTGAAFGVNVAAAAPGFLAPASFSISGKQYVVALFSDSTYVLPGGAIPGVASRPAKAGDAITLYGTGFGAVTPASAPGQIVTQQNQIAQKFQISIGGAPASLTYYGLAPGYVGLYQFNVVVPTVTATNPAPVTFQLNGTPGTQTLYMAIQN